MKLVTESNLERRLARIKSLKSSLVETVDGGKIQNITPDQLAQILEVLAKKDISIKQLPDYMYEINDGIKLGLNFEELMNAVRNSVNADELGAYIYHNSDPKKYDELYPNDRKAINESLDKDILSRETYTISVSYEVPKNYKLKPNCKYTIYYADTDEDYVPESGETLNNLIQEAVRELDENGDDYFDGATIVEINLRTEEETVLAELRWEERDSINESSNPLKENRILQSKNESENINKIEFIYDDTNNKLVDALKFFDTVKDNNFDIIQVRNSSDNSLDMEITKNSDNTYGVVYQGFYRTWNGPGYHTRPAKRKRSYKRLSALFDFITTWYNVNYDKIKRKADPYYEDPNDSPYEILTYSGLQLTPTGKRAKIRSAISDLTNMSDAKRVLKDFGIDVIKKDDRNYELVKDNEKYTLYILDNPNEVRKDLLKGAFKLLKINESLDSINEEYHKVFKDEKNPNIKWTGAETYNYKGFKIVYSPWEVTLGDKKDNIDSYIILSDYTANGFLLPLRAEDEEGNELNFNTLDQVKDWIDKYKDNFKIEIKHGDEVHAVVNSNLEESKNPLKAMARKHKRKQKGLSPFSYLNPNAGDVEYNIDFFNRAMGSGDATGTEGGEGLGESMKEELRVWGDEEISAQNSLVRWEHALEDFLENNNIEYDQVKCDVFDYGTNIVIVNPEDIEEVAQEIEDHYGFKTTIEDNNIYVNVTEEYEDEYGDIKTRVAKRYDESLDSEVTLQELADEIDYNGADYRGAEIPKAIDYMINQINIPDNMRLKWFDVDVVSDDVIQLTYVTQEPFSPTDSDSFIKEVTNMINVLANKYRYDKPFTLALDVTARDGRDEGQLVYDIKVNAGADMSLKEDISSKKYTLESKLYDYFKATNPNDPFGDGIDKEATFRDLFNAINDNANVYKVIFGNENSGDSAVREELFNGLANILNTSYDDVYHAWLGYHPLLESNNIIDIRKELNRLDSEEYRDLLNMYDSIELAEHEKKHIAELIFQNKIDELIDYLQELYYVYINVYDGNGNGIVTNDLGTFYKKDDLLDDGKFYKHEGLNDKTLKEDIDWDYFDKFTPIVNEYIPDQGEGETMASQIATAVNKLVYRWYNDGDTYDYVNGFIGGLSTYANWLYKYVPETRNILDSITNVYNDDEYENILKRLADLTLNEEFLWEYSTESMKNSIYECDGPFSDEEYWEDSEDEYSDEEDDYFESLNNSNDNKIKVGDIVKIVGRHNKSGKIGKVANIDDKYYNIIFNNGNSAYATIDNLELL